MSTLAKVFIVFNLILTVVFFGSAATLFMMRYNWREAYQTFKKDSNDKFAKVKLAQERTDAYLKKLEAERAKLAVENAQKAAQVNTQKEENASLKTTIGTKDTLIEAKDKAIESSQKTIQEQLAKITSQEDNIARLQQNEEKANTERNQAVRNATRLAIDISKKDQELSQALVAKAEAAAKVEKYEVMFRNLEQRGINPNDYEQPHIEGVVEAVNPSDRLVVLSVGQDQKVKPGFRFAVNRGAEYIGKVEVIEVYEDLSGARITYTKEPSRIQVGDTVVTESF